VLAGAIVLLLSQGLFTTEGAEAEELPQQMCIYGIGSLAIESTVPPGLLGEEFASFGSAAGNSFPLYSRRWREQPFFTDGHHFGYEYAEAYKVLRLLKILLDFPTDWPQVSLVLNQSEERPLIGDTKGPKPLAHLRNAPSPSWRRFSSAVYAEMPSQTGGLILPASVGSEDREYKWFLEKLLVPYRLVEGNQGTLSESLWHGDKRPGVAFRWSVLWVDLDGERYLYLFEPDYVEFFDSVEVVVRPSSG